MIFLEDRLRRAAHRHLPSAVADGRIGAGGATRWNDSPSSPRSVRRALTHQDTV
ncbi:hypothetical protein [Actinomadura kijaniata]|uniref:hypothetical protein n=1 Tax=Actinomadura kijaniata TaxID=46161 RepID=UPI0012F99AE9|nr:hypothetical protein [Actinomadura kijaniata]